MNRTNSDLHGNAPDKAGVALMLIDVINDLDFPGGDELRRRAEPMAERLAELKRRAKQAAVPVIYANDNFGRWQSNFHTQVEHCLKDGVPGESLVRRLRPEDDDYFVLKAKHSAFYSTTMDLLLGYLQVETLIITGIATNICVLFTANDAYMRDFRLIVPSDCVAANTEEEGQAALKQMESILKADIRPSSELDFSDGSLGTRLAPSERPLP